MLQAMIQATRGKVSLSAVPGPRVSGRLKPDESQAVTAGLSEDLAVLTPHHSPMAGDMGDRDSCGQEVPSK